MKTVSTFILLLVLCSCSKSDDLMNSRPNPFYNYVMINFVDETGNDASDAIEMQQVPGTSSIYRYYEMISEDFSYHCFINGEKVPLTYKLEQCDEYEHSDIELNIIRTSDNEKKSFMFSVNTRYILYSDISSDRLYEFEYRFKLPTLFGEKENSLKITKKASKIGTTTNGKVTFNGEKVSMENNKIKIFVKRKQ